MSTWQYEYIIEHLQLFSNELQVLLSHTQTTCLTGLLVHYCNTITARPLSSAAYQSLSILGTLCCVQVQ